MLCTDLRYLSYKSGERRKTSAYEGCAISHRLKWSPFPPNDDVKIAQNIKEGERRKESMGSVGRTNYGIDR